MADVHDYQIDENESMTVITDTDKGMEINVSRNSLNGYVNILFRPIADDD